jgi:hypothetical protein
MEVLEYMAAELEKAGGATAEVKAAPGQRGSMTGGFAATDAYPGDTRGSRQDADHCVGLG